MRIWLIKSTEPTPVDGPGVRLLRMSFLASALIERGHEIVWWNDDFNHFNKTFRYGQDKNVEINPSFEMRFIHGPGYDKHISLARFYDHRVIARKFLTFAEQQPHPDLLYACLPTLDLANAAARFGKKHGIPMILDIRDLWPDLIAEKAPVLLRPFVRLALAPYYSMARNACRTATAITGNTPVFVDWGLAHADRTGTEADRYFPFGYEEPAMTLREAEEADRFWEEQGLDSSGKKRIVTYIGMIGQNFQEDIIVRAAEIVKRKHDATFVFCGDGDRLAELRKKYAKNRSVLLPGRINAAQIWQLMRRTSLAVAAYKESENYRSSLTNKVIEYMAGGLPILFSIDKGYVADLIRKHEIGLTYGSSPERLADSIDHLLSDTGDRERLSRNSRNLYLTQFQRKTVYAEMAEHVERIAVSKRS